MSWAAAAAAGATMLSGVASNVATGKLNKKNRQWQEDMWNKTNDYNSPIMQMQRFKAAGLNPHLIYGQGNPGNATMAGAPQQTNQDFTPYAEAASNYVATRKQQTEIDNMKKAAEVMDADIALKNATATNQLSSSASTDQQKAQAAQLFTTTVQQAEANLRNSGITGQKMEAEIGNILQSTKASKQTVEESQQRISESAARIKSMAVENNLKGVETEIKKVELGMRKAGINPNDPAWSRILGRIFEESGLTNEAVETLKGKSKSYKLGKEFLFNDTFTLPIWKHLFNKNVK